MSFSIHPFAEFNKSGKELAINVWSAYMSHTGESKGKLKFYKWLDSNEGVTRKRGVITGVSLINTPARRDMEEDKAKNLNELLEEQYKTKSALEGLLLIEIENNKSLKISNEVLRKQLSKEQTEMEELKKEMRESELGELVVLNKKLLKENDMLNKLTDSYESTIKNLKQRLEEAGDYEYREDELKKEAAYWKNKHMALEEQLKEKDEELEEAMEQLDNFAIETEPWMEEEGEPLGFNPEEVAEHEEDGYFTEDEDTNALRICLETIQKKYKDVLDKLSEQDIEVIQIIKDELKDMDADILEAEGMNIAERIINEMAELATSGDEQQQWQSDMEEQAELARLMKEQKLEERRRLAEGTLELMATLKTEEELYQERLEAEQEAEQEAELEAEFGL